MPRIAPNLRPEVAAQTTPLAAHRNNIRSGGSLPTCYMNSSETKANLFSPAAAPVSARPASAALSSPPPPAAAETRVAATITANEELRARNNALLMKNAQLEEQMWRMRSAPQPSSDVPLAEGGFAPRADGVVTTHPSAAVTGTLWQFLDIALQGAVRARAEARRSHAETLISLDHSFNPLEKEARLKARALVAQSSRASAKLQGALQQLESEAAAALNAHDSDMAAWAARVRLLQTRTVAQQDAISNIMSLEVGRLEYEHSQHARSLELENDKVELQRAEERGWSKMEVRRHSRAAQAQHPHTFCPPYSHASHPVLMPHTRHRPCLLPRPRR